TVLEGIQQAPAKVIYANSIQAGNGSVYGSAKQQAAATLGTAAERSGSTFKNIMLPNLFGEYGRPFYNSVVATFSHLIANGEHPEVHQEKELQLLHAQNAADVLLGFVRSEQMVELA